MFIGSPSMSLNSVEYSSFAGCDLDSLPWAVCVHIAASMCDQHVRLQPILVRQAEHLRALCGSVNVCHVSFQPCADLSDVCILPFDPD